MNAYLYKSGDLIPVDTVHVDTLELFGVKSIDEAIKRGFVRIRHYDGQTAFQARSKDLLRAAVRSYFQTHAITSKVCIEFPGRYLELTSDELDDWL